MDTLAFQFDCYNKGRHINPPS